MSAGLDIERLSVRIPLPGKGWVHTAEDVSLRVPAGRVLAVVGESGCGKSVLAAAVMGLLPAGTRSAGRILLGAAEVSPSDRGRGVALVPQSAATHLTPVRTVGSVMAETFARHKLADGRAALDAMVQARLEAVGLGAGTASRYPHELSGGMAQRVLVAMILALDPEVLIADEPTSALDPETSGVVLKALRAHADSGRAVVLITHDLVAARGVADDVAVMYAGRILESGPASSVLHEPAHQYTRALLDALPENGLRPPPGTPSSLVDPPPGVCAWHQRVGLPCAAAGLLPHPAGHLVACQGEAQ